MHPTALAKRTQQSNRDLLAEVQLMADLLGIPNVTDRFALIKPSIRRPAETALKEREALVLVLKEIRQHFAATLEAHAQSPLTLDQPENGITRKPRKPPQESHEPS